MHSVNNLKLKSIIHPNRHDTYAPTRDLLKGKVILVTGASRGIGRAVAKAYAAHGATTILLARTITDLEELANDIIANDFSQPAVYPFNLATANADAYNDLRRTIDQHFGCVDGIVHNAGMLGMLTPIEQYPIETWYQVLQVNLNSVFLLTQALMPLLRRSANASVIFTGKKTNENIDFIRPSLKKKSAYWGAYAVAAAGIDSLMATLAAEYDNLNTIRFNQIIPPQTNTKLNNQAFPAADPASLCNPDAENIISHYLYLMGKDSADVNGSTFVL